MTEEVFVKVSTWQPSYFQPQHDAISQNNEFNIQPFLHYHLLGKQLDNKNSKDGAHLHIMVRRISRADLEPTFIGPEYFTNVRLLRWKLVSNSEAIPVFRRF
jgi:hypothetical protein